MAGSRRFFVLPEQDMQDKIIVRRYTGFFE